MGSKGNARAEPLDLSGNYAIRPGPSERNWGLELTQVVRNFPPGGPSNRVIRTHRREERVMDKREFMKVLGVGLGVAIVHPIKAAAQRGRILRSDPTDSAGAGAGPGFREFLGGGARGGTPPPPLPISTLEEARPRGDLVITERERAAVPDLIVDNRGKTHVLLLAGVILVGGKQNRIVTEDILLPPLSGPRSLGVYCVEQGRWSGASSSFSGQDLMAARGLREKVMEKADQRQVWAEVKKYAGRAGAASPTDNYQAIYDKPEVRAHQQEVEHSIPAPAPGGVQLFAFRVEALRGSALVAEGQVVHAAIL